MFFTAGKYQYGHRTVAYRSDYCLSCDDNTVSVQQRTFAVLQVYYVPVLPLGFRKHWHCTRCRKNPHARVKTSQGINILGLGVFSLFAAMTWLLPFKNSDDAEAVWGLRIGSGCLVALFAALILFHKRGSSMTLSERREALPRFTPTHCLFCGEPFNATAQSCAECQVEYL